MFSHHAHDSITQKQLQPINKVHSHDTRQRQPIFKYITDPTVNALHNPSASNSQDVTSSLLLLPLLLVTLNKVGRLSRYRCLPFYQRALHPTYNKPTISAPTKQLAISSKHSARETAAIQLPHTTISPRRTKRTESANPTPCNHLLAYVPTCMLFEFDTSASNT